MERIVLVVVISLALISCTVEKHYNEWVQKGNEYCYYNNSGEILRNTSIELSGATYYFDKNGYMLRDWQQFGSRKRYFDKNGVMAKGWKSVDGSNWYYFDNEGLMQTGWVQDGNDWYWFNENGIMEKDQWTKDHYFICKSGKMMPGLGKGYTSSITTQEDSSFNIDLSEAEYGSDIYFNFNRQNYDRDEKVIIECNLPNGTIDSTTYNWNTNHNILWRCYKNASLPGKWIIRLYDANMNLLVENDITIKSNPNRQRTYNESTLPIEQRIQSASFNDEGIRQMLVTIVECLNMSNKATSRIEKEWYRDQAFTQRYLLAELLNNYRVQFYGLQDYQIADIKLAEGFLKELGLKSY